MDNDELAERIAQSRAAAAGFPELNLEVNRARADRQTAENAVIAAERAERQARQDLDRLRRLRWLRIVGTLRGTHAGRVDAAEQTVAVAGAAHQSARNELVSLRQRERRSGRAAVAAQRAGSELTDLEEEQRLRHLRMESDPVSVEALGRVGEASRQIEALQARVRELSEASRAVDGVRSSLAGARTLFRSAEEWADYDVWFGGSIVGGVKYDKIGQANAALARVRLALEAVRAELEDVEVPAGVAGLSVDPLVRAFDVWFDRRSTDRLVRLKIRDQSIALAELDARLLELVPGWTATARRSETSWTPRSRSGTACCTPERVRP